MRLAEGEVTQLVNSLSKKNFKASSTEIQQVGVPPFFYTFFI